jgi:protein TonB
MMKNIACVVVLCFISLTSFAGESDGRVRPPDPRVPSFVDIDSCKPSYPKSALDAEEAGTVRFNFQIDSNGRFLSATIVKSSGFKDLDIAALEGLRSCKFRAAVKDGKAVSGPMIFEYSWRLP